MSGDEYAVRRMPAKARDPAGALVAISERASRFRCDLGQLRTRRRRLGSHARKLKRGERCRCRFGSSDRICLPTLCGAEPRRACTARCPSR